MKKSTWIILGLVVVLGLIYLLTREDHVSVGVKRLKLPAFALDKADRIEIKSKDDVILLKQNDKWVLEIKKDSKERLVKADQSNVTSMLDAALLIRHSHYVTNMKEKLQELGLTGDEATTIKISSGADVVWELVLGKVAAGSGRYAKLPEDDDVYVVKGSFWQLTRNGLTDWRDREIMPLKEGEITSFKLFRGYEPYLSLVKEKDSDAWKFDSSQKNLPKAFRVDKDALSNLVRSALNLKASGFVDEQKELKTLVAKIVVHDDNKKSEIQFYASSDENYLAKNSDDDQIYEVSKYNFDRINKPLEELRDLTILNFDRAAIVKLTLMHGKEKVVVSKKDNAWHIEQPMTLPKGFEFDPMAVDDMLSMLSGLAAQRIATTKDRPQNSAWHTTWLSELVTDKGDKVHFYVGKTKSNADEYLVKGNNDQETYVVKGARLLSLLAGLNAFNKEHFELPPVDENTEGFRSLPKDIQLKLLDAAKKRK